MEEYPEQPDLISTAVPFQGPEEQKLTTTAHQLAEIQDLKDHKHHKVPDLPGQKIQHLHVSRKQGQPITLLQEVMPEVQVAAEVPAEAAVVQVAVVQDLQEPEEANSIIPELILRGK